MDHVGSHGRLDSDEQTLAVLQESEALYRELGDASGLVLALNHLGNLMMNQGDFGFGYVIHISKKVSTPFAHHD